MLRRVFKGSSSQLVLHALGSAPPATAGELADIRALLDRIEHEGSSSDDSTPDPGTADDKANDKD